MWEFEYEEYSPIPVSGIAHVDGWRLEILRSSNNQCLCFGEIAPFHHRCVVVTETSITVDNTVDCEDVKIPIAVIKEALNGLEMIKWG